MARGKRQSGTNTRGASPEVTGQIIQEVRLSLEMVRLQGQTARLSLLEALVGKDPEEQLEVARSGLWLEPRFGPHGREIDEDARLEAILGAQENGRDDLADLMAEMLAEWADRRRVELEDQNRQTTVRGFHARHHALVGLRRRAESLGSSTARQDRLAELESGPVAKTKRAAALNPLITRLLSAGDFSGVRVAVKELLAHEGDDAGQATLAGFGDEEVERLSRYKEAQRALGQPEGDLARLLLRLEDRDLARIASPRRVGEEFALEGAEYRRVGLFEAHAGPSSAHDFVSEMRDTIDQRRFHSPAFNPGPRRGEEVYCPIASREAFADLVVQNENHPSFCGVKILACPDHGGTPGARRLFAAARFVGEVDGETIAANAVVNLGKDSRASVPRAMIAQGLELLDAAGYSPSAGPPHTGGSRWRDRVDGAYGWHGMSRGELIDDLPAAGPLPDGWTPESDLCRHPSARWQQNQVASAASDGQAYCDALHLVCDDCGRSRIACLPLHQVPPSIAAVNPMMAIVDPDTYLRREAAYAALEGKPAATSITELRARDGLLPLNQDRWLSGTPPVARRAGASPRARVEVDDLGASRRPRT